MAAAGSAAAAARFAEPCRRAVEYSLAHFLHDQAVFFAERLAAALPASDEALRLLAVAHLGAGSAALARQLLQERRSADPQLRYLLALCCLRLDKPEEVEAALLSCGGGRGGGSSSSRAGAGRDALAEVPGGGPGLYLLGQAQERLQRPEQAAECYSKCLELCPFMWCAYERLSRLSLGLPDPLARESSRAAAHFSDHRFQLHPVLRCPDAATEDASAMECDAANGRPSEARPAPAGPEKPKPASACSDSLPGAAARKRRRSCSASPRKGLATPETPPALSPRRRPLADRSVAPQPPGQQQPQQSPTPASASTPTQTPVRTPAQLLARLSPRRLLRRTRSRDWSSPARSPRRSPFVVRGSPLEQATPAQTVEEADEEPSLAGLLRLLGEALHALHGFDCALALDRLRRLPARERETPTVMDMAARCHLEMADYPQAAEVYARCCAKHKMHRRLGVEYYSTALWHLREPVRLSGLAQQALDWDRLWPQSWCAVGNCLSLQREHEQAIRAFRRAVQVDPSFAYAYTLIAHEYAALEKFDKAIETYELAIGIDGRHYNAWWGLGNVYQRQEEYQKARYHFTKAAAINGSNAVLKTSLGAVLQSLGEPERALQLFSSALQGQPPSPMASFHRGAVLVALGRREEALEELRRAQGLAPREPCVHFQLGRVHAALGDPRKALTHYTMAMDLCGPKDSKAIVAAQVEIVRAGGQQRAPELGP